MTKFATPSSEDSAESGHGDIKTLPVKSASKSPMVSISNNGFSKKIFLSCVFFSVPLVFLIGYRLHTSTRLYNIFGQGALYDALPIANGIYPGYLSGQSNSLQSQPYYGHDAAYQRRVLSGSPRLSAASYGYPYTAGDSPGGCSPLVNIAFIKVHKAGSTTVASIFLRFAYHYRLSAAVPSRGMDVWLGWPGPLTAQAIMPPYRGSVRKEPYNILAHHSVYNEERFKAIMPPDTTYLAILREPYQHFRSSFRYMEAAEHLKIQSADPLVEFLKNPAKYEKPFYGYGKPFSLTRNIQSYDMGVPTSIYNNATLVANYIRYLDSRFRLILILEHIEESIVLMKRYLCWRMEDVIFIKVLPHDDHRETRLTQDSAYLRQRHLVWSRADHMLYDYFNQTLWQKIQREPQEDFYDELRNFRQVLSSIAHFCDIRRYMSQPLTIPKSKWNKQFAIPYSSCKTLRTNDLQYTSLFRTRYRNIYR